MNRGEGISNSLALPHTLSTKNQKNVHATDIHTDTDRKIE